MNANISEQVAPRRVGRPSVEAPSTPAIPLGDASDDNLDVLRATRRPFGAHRQKLSYATREGFHRHWFKDSIPGRIDDALAAGYKHVKDNTGRIVARISGTAEGGSPETSYLMELPIELYQEDMFAQRARDDKLDIALKQGAVGGGEPGKDGRYVPTTGIKISRGS